MNLPGIFNILAWAGSGVFAVLLFGDFIHTELKLIHERQKREEDTDENNAED